jgi:hypothetical protein
MRFGIRPAEAAIDRVTGAEDWRGLLERNLVGNEVSGVGVHRHELGVTALRFAACALHIRTEHSAATLAPFAPSAGGLNPCRTHAVANLSGGDVGSHSDDLADWLVAEDSGK